MQRQHPQRMKDVQALVKELVVALARVSWLRNAQVLHLHVFLVGLLEHLLQLHDL